MINDYMIFAMWNVARLNKKKPTDEIGMRSYLEGNKYLNYTRTKYLTVMYGLIFVVSCDLSLSLSITEHSLSKYSDRLYLPLG